MVRRARKKRKHRFIFSQYERERVLQAVQRAEKDTTGEIVPWVVNSCKGYRWVHGLLTLSGIILTTSLLAVKYWNALWELHFVQIVLWQSIGGAVGFALSIIPSIKRTLIPRTWMAEEVHQRAMASFVAAKLPQTRDRNGVLIFVALFERRVEILADQGIASQVPAHFWKDRVNDIVEGIHEGIPIDALCQSIHMIARTLAEHFPRDPHDKNELEDELREG